MRIPTFLPLILLGLGSCTPSAPPTKAIAPTPAMADTTTEDSDMVHLQPLTGSGLRFDGVYDSPMGSIHYFMRFFERGNVALVAGWQRPGDPIDISSYLTRDVKSGMHSVHNVPVTWRGDSLFFTTMAMRGAIIYAGSIDGDSLHFNKLSKVNGRRSVADYSFRPDSLGRPVQ